MRRAITFLIVVLYSAEWSQGFDHASSCTRPYRAARGLARNLPPAPCDLSKHNYCTTPGTNYPWHAIRRFVRENQGLMKRMYGEERHIAVIKAELENFIEDDDDDSPKKPAIHDDDVIQTKFMYSKKSHGRAMKGKPHFRPIQSTTNPTIDKNKKYDNDTLKVKPLQNVTEATKTNKTDIKKDNKTELSNETIDEEKGIAYKTKLESIANVEISSLEQDIITLDAVIKQSIETNSIFPNYPTGTLKSESFDTEPKNETVIERNLTTTTENSINPAEVTTDTKIASEFEITASEYDRNTNESDKNTNEFDKNTSDSEKDGSWKPMHDTSTLPPTLLFSEHEKVKNDKVDNDKKEEFHQKPSHHQDSVRPAVIKLRGANACESKEEMAAPFWANSTRGEVLALLNMYPFEQYIHLETCVHERKQMYCREGCRCEQQYRLHRLLAYDPRNECRGIFADWFKFPACCICRCYDVPLEFRARSPRILRPQYDDDVKQAIYDDVARDWYAQTYDDLEDIL